jgi:hypothetical protein
MAILKAMGGQASHGVVGLFAMEVAFEPLKLNGFAQY